VAAWADISSMATVLRRGVDMPLQYTDYSETEDIEGSQWLEVRDMTEGSTLTTWYNTDYSPAVAVTTHTDDKPKGLKQALEVLDKAPQHPRPAPLAQLSSADNAEVCTSLMDEIPDTVGEDYERFAVTEEKTAAWGAEGREPI